MRDDFGQAIAELALLMPLLAFLLVGGADMGRAFAIQLAVQNGARAGAEASALDYTPTLAEAQAHATQEMNRTPGMNAAQATITWTKLKADGTACPVTPDYNNPCYFTVRVQYTFRTIIPWPLMPNVFNFDRSTAVRSFN
ncbi:MAG TPA: TadE/TadG family type IV pilus assembly protein [Candidatus Limnocylindria bacterium]|nr:TadE/TadG family type IV pilus assembly protein [Candidatus Limnocylindria bacterium]